MQHSIAPITVNLTNIKTSFDFAKCFLFVALAFYVSSFGSAAISFVSVFLAIFAFTGKTPMRAFVTVFLIYLLVAGNPFIITAKPFLLGMARYVSIAAIAFKSYLYFYNHPKRQKIFNQAKGALIPLGIFVFIAICTSVLANWYLHISLLKATQFFVFVSSLILFRLSIDRESGEKLYVWCLAILAFIILSSLFHYLVNPYSVYYVDEWEPGKFINTDLFCGIIYHPQSLGLVAVFTIAHSFKLLFDSKSFSVKLLIFILCGISFYFITLTQSRTSLFAVVFLITSTSFKNIFFNNIADRNIAKRRRKNTLNFLSGGIFICILGLALKGKVILGFITELLFKYSTYRVSFTDLFYSRMNNINNSWEAFLASPIFGEGFGVEKSAKFIESAGLFTAPSEKCFIPTAILHELGIIGAVAFIYFLVSITIWASRYKHGNFIFLMYTFILINFGEYIIFSIGGAGCLGWLILSSSLSESN
ncbi:MAG: hypothetical protein P8I61_03325 [Opitutae bacterium]|nr:hypothetical protein [Opitutae bacterium]